MRATPLPARALLSRAEWLELGVSTQRLKGDDLVAPFPGFLTPSRSPATVNTMCEVLQERALPGAVISHSTAAALLGIAIPWWIDDGIGSLASASYSLDGRRTIPSTLPLPDPPSGTSGDGLSTWQRDRLNSGLPLSRIDLALGEPEVEQTLTRVPVIHCSVTPEVRRSLGPGVRVHRTPPRPAFRQHGVVVSHPYVVLLELASMLSYDDLVIAVDSLIARRPPMTGASIEAIERTIEKHPGSHGIDALRRALRDARPGTDSPGETRTRLLLQRAGFPEPVINLPVKIPKVAAPRLLDLAYPDLKIAVEYDGDYHRQTRGQWSEDQGRRDTLASLGWDIRIVTGNDITRPARILTALHRSWSRAGATPPPVSNWEGQAERELARPLGPPSTGRGLKRQ